MQALAHRAYGEVQQRTADEKGMELAVFEQITQALQVVEDMPSPNPGLWADALNRNANLWTLLATDLLHTDNALAPETRRGLLTLSAFVQRTTLQILGGEGEIGDLVDINTNIIQGLIAGRAVGANGGA